MNRKGRGPPACDSTVWTPQQPRNERYHYCCLAPPETSDWLVCITFPASFSTNTYIHNDFLI